VAGRLRTVVGLLFVGLFGFLLEYLGTHAKCYAYGEAFPARLFLVPPVILAMWMLLGFLAWKTYQRWGLLPGLLAPLAVDWAVLEPLAKTFGLWTWQSTATPRIWFDSTIGNAVVYVWVAGLAIWILGRLCRESVKVRQTNQPSDN